MALSDLDRMAQERDHFKVQAQNAMKASARHLAIVQLATAFAWTTADGELLRITCIDDVWCVDLEDQSQAVVGTLEEALALAVETAPPADSDLADLLTWTACGHSRV